MPHPRIDAHLHLWNRSASDYAWITPDLGDLYADFGPADARAELLAAGIDAAVLVQAEDSAADTRFMLEVAASNPWVLGVVGWVPLTDPAAAAVLLEEWLRHPVFRGVRQLVHIDPSDVLGDPRTIETLRLVADAGLAFDVPDAWPRHLGAVARVAASVPDLTVVIDHLGKPPVGTDSFDTWARQLRDAAAQPNTVAKLSGLQGLGGEFTARALRPAWDIAIDAFGPARLMYGGDWPMTIGHGGYAATWEVLGDLIGELSPHEQADLLAGTARRAYRLEP